ncbi:DUF2798 domain-containing protein [Aestuariibacter halophilus]|uniref:DUF2798 domain-containing protein n=1 Tax=Fluctibacter halophilus TaxID=226011 RepID=A0ABS8G6Q7_9ALTE|nr:DUF2798 domain-containing protein [Aestuariibacter halophilus]MCC2614896.1 DUF2798 domain-containing protein [Aestuariibacter halophilus]
MKNLPLTAINYHSLTNRVLVTYATPLLISFVMSFLMSGVMSLTMLALESSTVGEVFASWPKAWAVAMLVAFPVSLIVVPFTKRLVSQIIVSA